MNYPPQTRSAVTDASGTATVEFVPRGAGPLQITQISPEAPAAAANAACAVRRNGAFVCPLVPTGDAAAGEPFVDCNPGDVVAVVWTLAPAGVTCTATFFFRDAA